MTLDSYLAPGPSGLEGASGEVLEGPCRKETSGRCSCSQIYSL